jgi:hypothetical protein
VSHKPLKKNLNLNISFFLSNSFKSVTGGCIPITTTGQPQSSVVPVTSTNDIKNAAMELSPFLSVITSLLMVLLALHYSS